jgi:hypothetical protein
MVFIKNGGGERSFTALHYSISTTPPAPSLNKEGIKGWSRLVPRKREMLYHSIVCQINILVGVQALAWFCQTKVWTPFSESLYQPPTFIFSRLDNIPY